MVWARACPLKVMLRWVGAAFQNKRPQDSSMSIAPEEVWCVCCCVV